jgi:hypothetical protein
VRRVGSTDHLEDKLASQSGLFGKKRCFGHSGDSEDVFGEIMAGFIPVEDAGQSISAEVNNGIIYPPFSVQSV